MIQFKCIIFKEYVLHLRLVLCILQTLQHKLNQCHLSARYSCVVCQDNVYFYFIPQTLFLFHFNLIVFCLPFAIYLLKSRKVNIFNVFTIQAFMYKLVFDGIGYWCASKCIFISKVIGVKKNDWISSLCFDLSSEVKGWWWVSYIYMSCSK